MSWCNVCIALGNDHRKLAMFMSAAWATVANLPAHMLANYSLNTFTAFNLASALDGDGAMVSAAALVLVS